ncbi:MAG: HAMP domain-containing sensor histidine kinase [Kofleriaceae bacterium]
MLSEFVTANRSEIIERCRELVAGRMAPRATDLELEQGIPLFLDQLASTLRSKLDAQSEKASVGATAKEHGGELLRIGFTVGQVVHDYGDVCQTITALAIERNETFTNVEFQALNLCLDEAIAGAVTEYERQHDVAEKDIDRTAKDLGFGVLVHELRNMLGTATLACEALSSGSVGISGSTGAMLRRSLSGMRGLLDGAFADLRLKAGIVSQDRIVVDDVIEEVELSAMMHAKERGHQLTVDRADAGAAVLGDRQILAAIVANLVQNAFKYTHPRSHVSLRTSATADHVRIEVEDECGGLPPGKAETLFKPFEQRGTDRSGLGLGLAICLRGVEAIGGVINVHDLPGKGCVFSVELRRAPNAG